MVFKHKAPLSKRLGEKRVIRKYLWWPTSFDATETRWLERSYILQQVKKKTVYNYDSTGYNENMHEVYYWSCEKFVTKKDYEIYCLGEDGSEW
jgi:hypothetical protein